MAQRKPNRKTVRKTVKRKCRAKGVCGCESCTTRRRRTVEGAFPRRSDTVRVAAAGMKRPNRKAMSTEQPEPQPAQPRA